MSFYANGSTASHLRNVSAAPSDSTIVEEQLTPYQVTFTRTNQNANRITYTKATDNMDTFSPTVDAGSVSRLVDSEKPIQGDFTKVYTIDIDEPGRPPVSMWSVKSGFTTARTHTSISSRSTSSTTRKSTRARRKTAKTLQEDQTNKATPKGKSKGRVQKQMESPRLIQRKRKRGNDSAGTHTASQSPISTTSSGSTTFQKSDAGPFKDLDASCSDSENQQLASTALLHHIGLDILSDAANYVEQQASLHPDYVWLEPEPLPERRARNDQDYYTIGASIPTGAYTGTGKAKRVMRGLSMPTQQDLKDKRTELLNIWKNETKASKRAAGII